MEGGDHKYDTTLGRLDVHTCIRGRACRVASPLAKRVLGLQPALSAHADDGQPSVSLSAGFCLQAGVESKEQKSRPGTVQHPVLTSMTEVSLFFHN